MLVYKSDFLRIPAMLLFPPLPTCEVVVALQDDHTHEYNREDTTRKNLIFKHLRAHLSPVGEGQEHVLVFLSKEECAVASHEGEGPEGYREEGLVVVEGK